VVQVAPTGVSTLDRGGHLRVVAAAGEEWDGLVVRSLAAGSAALAPLSGIPGLIGAAPIQNIGAYGVEVSDFIESVRVWDRDLRAVRELSTQECEFGYRTSMFKRIPDRFVVLEVVFDLTLDETACVNYPQLAQALEVDVGRSLDGSRIRHAVLDLRRSKGMVLDDQDRDTWSVGSFFVNPVVSEEIARSLPAACPVFGAPGGMKVSAAWLIANSGIECGFRLPQSGARVSTKHTLAICNANDATCQDILDMAREIRSRVRATFGIELVPEPRLVGCRL
jgi:UDP-N-acetylmuramate dehydrogenase